MKQLNQTTSPFNFLEIPNITQNISIMIIKKCMMSLVNDSLGDNFLRQRHVWLTKMQKSDSVTNNFYAF